MCAPYLLSNLLCLGNTQNELVWQLFWYNPVQVLFSSCSLLSSSRYLAISLLILATTIRDPIPFFLICFAGVHVYPELIILVPSLYSLFICKELPVVIDGISGIDITVPVVIDGSNMKDGSDITTGLKFISSIFNSFSLAIVALYFALRNCISLPGNIAISFQQLQHPSTWTSAQSAILAAFQTLLTRCKIDIDSLFTRESIFSGGYYHHGNHKSYQPAAGVLWYLDAQMLPAYELYFEVRLAIFIMMVLTYLLPKRYKLISKYLASVYFPMLLLKNLSTREFLEC